MLTPGFLLLSRIIHGPKGSLLTVFNDIPEDQATLLEIPSQYHRVKDLYREQEIPVAGSSIQVTVPYRDVSVYLLEA